MRKCVLTLVYYCFIVLWCFRALVFKKCFINKIRLDLNFSGVIQMCC